MASQLGTIKAQIATDLETTSLVAAFNTLGEENATRPFATFIIGGADIDYDCNYVMDNHHEMSIEITGSTEDGVDEVLEEIQKLWMNSTAFNTLRGLGVLDITPLSKTCAIEDKGDQAYYGFIQFRLVIRMDYTT